MTAREIFNLLSDVKKTAYSTTVKMLSVMLEKDLVYRDESAQPQIYRAARTRARTQKGMLKDLIDRAYEGSAAHLIMQALSSHRATPAEIAEMKAMIESLEDKS